MSVRTSVDSFQSLGDATAKLNDYSSSYTQISNQLIDVASTMEHAWQGKDNLAYVNRINGLVPKLKWLADKLTQMGEIIASEQAAYEAFQSDTAGKANSLPN